MTPTQSPLISVILPAYNSARFLEATVASVLTQSLDDLELLIVNDGSTDATSTIAQGLADQRMRLIEQENRGISEARNTGLRAARGRYIAFIDHDDIWHPDKLKVQVQAFEQADSQTAICYGEFIRWPDGSPDEFPSEVLSADRSSASHSGWIYHQLLLTNWVLLSTALFKREVFDTVGLFDPELPPADDWDMVLRASRRYRFLKLSQALALYRVHPGQTSRRKTAKDTEHALRHSMILRYGLASPDGRRVDSDSLRERDIRSHLSYFGTCLLAGDLRSCRRALGQALSLAPLDRRCWRALASLLHRSLRPYPTTPTAIKH